MSQLVIYRARRSAWLSHCANLRATIRAGRQVSSARAGLIEAHRDMAYDRRQLRVVQSYNFSRR